MTELELYGVLRNVLVVARLSTTIQLSVTFSLQFGNVARKWDLSVFLGQHSERRPVCEPLLFFTKAQANHCHGRWWLATSEGV